MDDMRSFRLHYARLGVPHRRRKIAECHARFSSQYGIAAKSRKMLRGKMNHSSRIDDESPEASSNATGKPQLARRIQEEEQPLAYAIALPSRPGSDPLRQDEIVARRNAANGLVHVKGNGNSFDRLFGVDPVIDSLARISLTRIRPDRIFRRSEHDCCHRAREDRPGSSRKLSQSVSLSLIGNRDR